MESLRIFQRSLSTFSSGSSGSFRITPIDSLQVAGSSFDLEQGRVYLDLYPSDSLGEHKTTAKSPPLNFELPKVVASRKKSTPPSRVDVILHQQDLLSTYNILLVLSIVSNLICLILATVGRLPSAKNHAATVSVANVVTLVLCRSEVFLRCFFWLVVKFLGHRWVPLIIKTAVTSILQSVGGIHNGCGLSAVFWLVYAIVNAFMDRKANPILILSIAFAILVLFGFSILAAIPIVRHKHHNVFERTHRIAGWTSLALLWAFIMLKDGYDPESKSYSVGGSLKSKVELWLTVVVTIIIMLPWLSMRKVPVKTVVSPSKNNSLIHFEGGVKPGLLARISRSPLSEWHAFGIISDGKSHTVLAGAVGDFTKGLVESPPSYIWVRSFHFAGLPYLTNLYGKVLHVATGSGICVFFSFLLQETKADVHVIWITKSLSNSYGEEFHKIITSIPGDRLTVFDTAVTGRPKTVEVVVNKVKDWGAECVIVTSNPIGSNEIVGGCKAAGIPAFGPIWDS
ncbi:hypothetical protein R1flu_026756 [Riccia fluitans]|uniref:Uncharacterized protein n=1 Tax=Riccia fluitans TaxID=41844 RepID=A0ABD1XGU5_9MARC